MGKKLDKLSGSFSTLDSSEMEEKLRQKANEDQSAGNEDLTAEKVFFSGLNKKLPVEEHSTLSKITKVSLSKNSV